jgi:uncharacterized protein
MDRVYIGDILKSISLTKEIKEDIDLTNEDGLYELADLVNIDLIATNLEECVLLQGKIYAKLKLECVRCTESFSYLLEAEIEEEYRSEDKIFQFNDQDSQIGEDDLIFTIDSKKTIDVGEAVREAVISALPMKPVCGNCKEIIHYTAEDSENIKKN